MEALAIAVLSVAFGAFLGLSEALGKRVLGAIQTFGFTAAIGLVLLQLLPEAFVRLGWIALVLFLVASRVPAWLERAAQRAARSGGNASLGIDLAYLGFAVHQIADGVSMGTFSGGVHAHHDHGDYFLATAGHTIPLTALLVGMIAAARGKRAALWRAGGLAIAVALGIALPAFADMSVLAHADAWIGAVAAGLLFHAVGHASDDHAHAHAHGHDHAHERPSRATAAIDFVAGALGFTLALVAEHGAGGGDHVHIDPMHALSDATLLTVPCTLVALAAAILHARRGAPSLAQAADRAARRVLPWFAIASVAAAALLSVSSVPLAERAPPLVLLAAHALGAVLAAITCAYLFVVGTRPFLLRALGFLSAHSHAHHDTAHHHEDPAGHDHPHSTARVPAILPGHDDPLSGLDPHARHRRH